MRRDERKDVNPCPLKENHRCNWQKVKCILTKLLIIPFLIHEINFMGLQRCDRFTLSRIHFRTLSLISKHTALPPDYRAKQQVWEKNFLRHVTRRSPHILQNNMDTTCNMDTLTDVSPSCCHMTVLVRFREGLQG